jgi:hypothetical protein
MRRSLDETMEYFLRFDDGDLEPFRRDYVDCLQTAYGIYGESTFRLPDYVQRERHRKGALSRVLYDAVMVGIHSLMSDKSTHEKQAISVRLLHENESIRRRTMEILSPSDRRYGLLVGRLNTKQSILDRIGLMEQLFRDAVGL